MHNVITIGTSRAVPLLLLPPAVDRRIHGDIDRRIHGDVVDRRAHGDIDRRAHGDVQCVS